MAIFPAKNETIVSSHNAQNVISLLKRRTYNIELEETDESSVSYLFQGVIKKDSFRISKKTLKAENFNPLLIGNVENTSSGSIIFIKYRLMQSTKIFFAFWTSIAIILSLIFVFVKCNYLHAAFAFLLGLGNYLITLVNFNMHSEKARQSLTRVLNDQSID
ncbi:hypothetical protein [Marinigracilibium pacificum]|uniref:Uncharacterized protein n=1 Tax=Marinigracilibium pacificum TaxID=2729599 RepID=A0A848ITE0_9BACT|nr:hypothetical protein [Marinigracilibium pacificum]NMM47036.1 hypothetical protein [Marinigracilibium pacificum]